MLPANHHVLYLDVILASVIGILFFASPVKKDKELCSLQLDSDFPSKYMKKEHLYQLI